MQEQVEVLKAKIAEVKLKQEEKLADREVYFHIDKRLVTTKIHLDMKYHLLQKQLNIKDHFLSIEKRTFMKSREGRCRSARVYKNIDKSAQFYNNNKEKIKEKIDKDRELLENVESVRHKRQQRYQDIRKQVDDEETIRKFKGIREGIMLHRSWFMFLSNKLNANREEFGTIELAFRKIRGVTGLYDINDVVEKFLTKENSYHELMNSIVINKNAKESLLQRNNDLETKIQKITISETISIKEDILQELNEKIISFTNRNIYDKQRKEIMNTRRVNIQA